MSLRFEEFVGELTAHGLVSASDVADAEASVAGPEPPEDPSVLADKLIRLNKLTPFQAEAVLSGRSASLVFGDYVVLDRIGQGGMGVVFKAMHRVMHRMVAVKRLPQAMTQNESAVQRFYREVRAAAKLLHPNIVAAYDAGESHGRHYLVMEYVDGEDLSAMIARQGRLAVAQAVDVIAQAARGLAYAHGEGIIHRDIKPGNILVSRKGDVKLLDMGLARVEQALAAGGKAEQTITVEGRLMGTVEYMAPEQAADAHKADHRSDIYALGCTLYRAITGKLPYAGDTAVAKIMAHTTEPIPPLREAMPDVPEQLEAIYQRMVAKQSGDRPASMAEVADALAALVNEGVVEAWEGHSLGLDEVSARDVVSSSSVDPDAPTAQPGSDDDVIGLLDHDPPEPDRDSETLPSELAAPHLSPRERSADKVGRVRVPPADDSAASTPSDPDAPTIDAPSASTSRPAGVIDAEGRVINIDDIPMAKAVRWEGQESEVGGQKSEVGNQVSDALRSGAAEGPPSSARATGGSSAGAKSSPHPALQWLRDRWPIAAAAAAVLLLGAVLLPIMFQGDDHVGPQPVQPTTDKPFTGDTIRPEDEWVDLLPLIDTTQDAMHGEYRFVEGRLEPVRESLNHLGVFVRLPVLTGDFFVKGGVELVVKGVQRDGALGVGISNGKGGVYTQIEDNNGKLVDNARATEFKPLPRPNGERFELKITARQADDSNVAVAIDIDGETVFDAVRPWRESWLPAHARVWLPQSVPFIWFPKDVGGYIDECRLRVLDREAKLLRPADAPKLNPTGGQALAASAPRVVTPADGWVDLRPNIDPTHDAPRGGWTRAKEGFVVLRKPEESHHPNLRLPVSMTRDWRVRAVWSQVRDPDGMGFYSHLLGQGVYFKVKVNGEQIEGRDHVRDLPLAIPLSKLRGKKLVFEVVDRVVEGTDEIRQEATINGEPFVIWQGRRYKENATIFIEAPDGQSVLEKIEVRSDKGEVSVRGLPVEFIKAAPGEPRRAIDLTSLIDVKRDALNSDWVKTPDGGVRSVSQLAVDKSLGVPIAVDGDYRLRLDVSFGDHPHIAFGLPTRSQSYNMLLNYRSYATRLHLVSFRNKPNPTELDFKPERGRRYVLEFDVSLDSSGSGLAGLVMRVDGRQMFDVTWPDGKSPHPAGALRLPAFLQLGWGGDGKGVTIHSATLTLKNGSAKLIYPEDRAKVRIIEAASKDSRNGAITPAAGPRWPLQPSRAEDIKWLLDLGATLTLRTGPDQEIEVKPTGKPPAGPATIVGVVSNLKIDKSLVDDEFLKRLGTLVDVETLTLAFLRNGQRVATNDGLRHLTALKHLRHLRLGYFLPGGTDPAFLEAFQGLETLMLTDTSQKGFELVIARLPALRSLRFHAGELPDLDKIGRPPQLSELVLSGRPGSRPNRIAAAQRFAERVPWCRVSVFDDKLTGNSRIDIEPTAPMPGSKPGTDDQVQPAPDAP